MASRRLRACVTAFATAGLVAAAAGCATVPISAGPQVMPGTSGQPQEFVQPLPPPGPQPNWDAKQVVLGFLHASASFALDPSAARAYLAQPLEWNPNGPVTVVSPNLAFGPTTSLPHASGQTTQVIVTSQRIATLSTSGQYSYESGAATQFTFQLAKYGSKLLIQDLPAGTHLLLTQTDFEEVFQPRNLYFPSPGFDLVPDPVYVPVQGPNGALSTNVAGSLVNGLINDRASWLSGATTMGFPPGTKLLKPVTISSQTALVDLGGKVDTATPAALNVMYAQLKQTLTSSAYTSAVATSVQLAINGKPWSGSATLAGVPEAGTATSGHQPQSLYFASGGVVKLQRSSGAKGPVLAPGTAQLASPAGISALAVSGSPGSELVAAAVPRGQGCAVRVGGPGLAGSSYSISYIISAAGGPCTSLSWDNHADLWVVSGSGSWVIQPGSAKAVPVSLRLPIGARVLALRMAPDAVRAALLVKTPGNTQLYLAAVRFTQGVSLGPAVPVGTDLSSEHAGISAMCWYSPYDLLAAGTSGLYEVPLTGGVSTSLGAVPAGVQSLSAIGGHVAVGTSRGVYLSSSPYIMWNHVQVPATAPAFPG